MEGIVLKSLDYQETSKIVYIYTLDGLESILIKGAKKMQSKFRSFPLTYNYVKYEKSKAKFPILIDGDIIKQYTHLYNLDNNFYASIMNDAIIKLHGEKDEKLYHFFIKCLEKDPLEEYVIIFMLKLLFILGIAPQFTCGCQKQEDIIGFCIEEGRLICPKCYQSGQRLYDIELTLLIKRLYQIDINKEQIFPLEQGIKVKLWDFILNFYLIHLNYQIKIKKSTI